MDKKVTFAANADKPDVAARRLIELLRHFEGRNVDISISRMQTTRSLRQNSYYWGVVIPLAQVGFYEIGYDFDEKETHEFLKNKFLSKDVIDESTGEVLGKIATTRKISTLEAEKYYEDIRRFGAEFLNINIPMPNEEDIKNVNF